MAEEAAIQIRDVSKSFGPLMAVDDLDLSVPYGSMCGFLGPNGAGKTTTIRMIMAIIFPDKGSVEVLGRKSAVESKDRIGYLPEERGVYRKMRVGEFLVYMGRLKGVDGAAAKQRAADWLERMELPGVWKKRLEELSKGMQQKVQVIATLIHDPELIILDEPFSGLDPVNARILRELILELNEKGKRTFIFSTHVLHQAEQICDRIFMINRGRKVLDGRLDEIRDRFDPRTLLVRFNGHRIDLGRLDGVMKTADLSSGEVEAHLEPQADAYTVMRQIVESGPVRKVELRRSTLDDIFLTLVADARLNERGEMEVNRHD